MPIRFILKSRRLNFLYYILSDKEDSLLSNVFRAQVDNPVKGDWVNTIKKDLEELEMNLSFEEIKRNTKEQFKRIVKEHVNEKAFEYLKNLQQTHSKVKPIQYEKFSLQSYLRADNKLTTKEKAFTFALRARMLELRANFKSGKNDLNCRLCNKHEENQQMLLKCSALNADHLSTPPYSDLYSEDADKVTRISMILKKSLKSFKSSRCMGRGRLVLSQMLLHPSMSTMLVMIVMRIWIKIYIYTCGNKKVHRD